MAQTLDIFRIEAEGGVRWVGGAETLEAAKVLIKADSAKQPGDFLIVCLATEWKLRLPLEQWPKGSRPPPATILILSEQHEDSTGSLSSVSQVIR